MTDKIFSYKSPEVKDFENDKIEFVFFYNFPCKCVELIAESSFFELRIDKTKLTLADSGL